MLGKFHYLGGGFLGSVSANSKEAPRLFNEEITDQVEGFHPGEVNSLSKLQKLFLKYKNFWNVHFIFCSDQTISKYLKF